MRIEQERSLASKQHKLKLRKRDPLGVILHTTGAGPWKRWEGEPERFPSPFEAALHVYGNVLVYSPHFVVCGETGKAAQLDSVDMRCLHVGSKGSWRYRLSGWDSGRSLEWWHRRFPDIRSPRELLGGRLWRGGSANELTLGIEVSPPLDGPRAPWTDACWATLRLLTAWASKTYDFPLSRYHVFTHSDAHPLARTTKSGRPWDPGPSQWRIADAVSRLRLK